MLLTNYHTHTNFCDGAEQPDLYAAEALKQNLKALGYSAHAPLPFPCTWTLPYKHYAEYMATIQSIKNKYKDLIEIYCGLEIDYIPGMWATIKEMLHPSQLDFFIGSIHFVDHFKDGTPWSIDGSHEEFRKGWVEIFNGDSHALVRKYFSYTRLMIKEMNPPVIGHLDKIKMQYRPDCFIPETDPVYRSELLLTLDEIASAGCIVEINTRGVYKRNENDFYPGKWVLTEMAKRNIAVMINSDAHRPHEISLLFDEARYELKKAGYHHIFHFLKNQWVKQPI